jgi:hypothetical protein
MMIWLEYGDGNDEKKKELVLLLLDVRSLMPVLLRMVEDEEFA